MANTEDVELVLPSGEKVNASVPTGLDDDTIRGLMKQQHPEYFHGTTEEVAPTPTPGALGNRPSQAASNHNPLYSMYRKATPESRNRITNVGLPLIEGEAAIGGALTPFLDLGLTGMAARTAAGGAIGGFTGQEAGGYVGGKIGGMVGEEKLGRGVGGTIGGLIGGGAGLYAGNKLPFRSIAGDIANKFSPSLGEFINPTKGASKVSGGTLSQISSEADVLHVPEPHSPQPGVPPGSMFSATNEQLPRLAKAARPGALDAFRARGGTAIVTVPEDAQWKPPGLGTLGETPSIPSAPKQTGIMPWSDSQEAEHQRLYSDLLDPKTRQSAQFWHDMRKPRSK